MIIVILSWETTVELYTNTKLLTNTLNKIHDFSITHRRIFIVLFY